MQLNTVYKLTTFPSELSKMSEKTLENPSKKPDFGNEIGKIERNNINFSTFSLEWE